MSISRLSAPRRVRATGRALVLAWLVLFFSSDFRFENRSPLASVEGDASTGVIVELASFCVAGAFALVILLRTKWLDARSPGLDMLAAYGVLAAASAAWSRIPLFSFVQGFQIVALALLAKASASLWSQGQRNLERDWRSIWMAFIAIVSALGAWGLLAGPGGGRFSWPGMHPLVVAGYLGAAIVMAAHFIVGSPTPSRRTRVLLYLAGAWCLWLLVLTVSRSVLAATVLSALLVLGMHAYRGPGTRRAAVLFALAFGMIALWWFTPTIAGYVLRGQSLEEFSTLTGRTDLWAYAFGLIAQAPIFGHGYGSGRFLLIEAFPWGGTGHNLWVEVGLGLGILGVLVVSILMWRTLRQGWLMAKIGQERVPLGALALGALVAVKSVALETLSVPGVDLVVFALISAGIAAHRVSVKKRSLRWPTTDVIGSRSA